MRSRLKSLLSNSIPQTPPTLTQVTSLEAKLDVTQLPLQLQYTSYNFFHMVLPNTCRWILKHETLELFFLRFLSVVYDLQDN